MPAGRRTPIHDVIHPEDLPQVLSTWQAAQAESAAAGGRPLPTSFIFRHRRRDGAYVWVESMSCITPTNFYGLIRDINNRKALEVRTSLHRSFSHVTPAIRCVTPS